jgi:hypothetical protein
MGAHAAGRKQHVLVNRRAQEDSGGVVSAPGKGAAASTQRRPPSRVHDHTTTRAARDMPQTHLCSAAPVAKPVVTASEQSGLSNKGWRQPAQRLSGVTASQL